MSNKAIVLKIPMLILYLPAIIFFGVLIPSLIKVIFKSWLSNDYPYLEWLNDDLADCENILELGCGRASPLLKIGAGKRTDAVDIWQPYVTMHNEAGDYRYCKQENILTMDLASCEKQYDAVVICDVLEHLPKDEVLKIDLFSAIEKVARKKVILFTPNGFVENDEVDDDPYQAHVSAWSHWDYVKRGYGVRGSTGVRWLMGKASLPKYRPHLLGQLLIIFTQPLVFCLPEIAWHTYAIKELE